MAKFVNSNNKFVVVLDGTLMESLRKCGYDGFTSAKALYMQVAEDTGLKFGKALERMLRFLYYKYLKSTLPAKKPPTKELSAKKLSPQQVTHVDDDSLKYHFNLRAGTRLISLKQICLVYKKILASHGTSPQLFRGRKACMELGIPPSKYNVGKITNLEAEIRKFKEPSSPSNVVDDNRLPPSNEAEIQKFKEPSSPSNVVVDNRL